MIICVDLPHFVIAVERLHNPDLMKTPFIVAETVMTQRRVLTISEGLAQSGIKPHMPLRPAQALAPAATVIWARPIVYHQIQQTLRHLLTDFTPELELAETAPALQVYLNLGKQTRGNAVTLAQQIGRTIRETTALEPALGLAGGLFPARIAALSTTPNRLRYLKRGAEAPFLADCSIDYLPIDDDLKERLHLLGLHTLGQVAGLSAPTLFNQFGYEGRKVHQLCRGQDPRTIKPCQPENIKTERCHFEEPVASRLILDSWLQRLATTLSSQLKAQSQACRTVCFAIWLENQATLEQKRILSQPTNGVETLLQTLSALLDQCPIDCGVVELQVQLSDLTASQGQQLDLFVHQNHQQQRLHQQLPALCTKYGPDAFIRPALSEPAAYLPQYRFRLQGAIAL